MVLRSFATEEGAIFQPATDGLKLLCQSPRSEELGGLGG